MDKDLLEYLISLNLNPNDFVLIKKTSSNVKVIEKRTGRVLDIRY